jgi:DNA (cytosine-5)-methyltransferase 1
MSKLVTVSEAAEQLDVSPDTIRRWSKKGLIKGSRNDHNYRIFDISEISRLNSKLNGESSSNNYQILKNKQKTNISVVELFAGAGGTALGFENAGIKHDLLIEIDKNAVGTLRANRKKWNVIADDIANVSFKDVKADVVEGGFPCQAFSYAGKGKGFGDTRGTLFFQFARAIEEINPKIAVGENVRGLLKHDKGRTLETMITRLERIGYRVAYRVLRSQYLDVPQKRERLIIIAIRSDLDLPFLFPKERDYTISLREALHNVPESSGQIYPKRKMEIMSLVPAGGYWRDLPSNIQKEYMMKSYFLGGGKTGMARRLSWDEPSLTLTTSPAQKQTERCHPEETRPLTVREYARIQTFPDTWIFSGSTNSQYKQIGNAVPVNLGYHVAEAVIAMLKKKPNSNKFIKVNDNFQPKQLTLV